MRTVQCSSLRENIVHMQQRLVSSGHRLSPTKAKGYLHMPAEKKIKLMVCFFQGIIM